MTPKKNKELMKGLTLYTSAATAHEGLLFFPYEIVKIIFSLVLVFSAATSSKKEYFLFICEGMAHSNILLQ